MDTSCSSARPRSGNGGCRYPSQYIRPGMQTGLVHSLVRRFAASNGNKNIAHCSLDLVTFTKRSRRNEIELFATCGHSVFPVAHPTLFMYGPDCLLLLLAFSLIAAGEDRKHLALGTHIVDYVIVGYVIVWTYCWVFGWLLFRSPPPSFLFPFLSWVRLDTRACFSDG